MNTRPLSIYLGQNAARHIADRGWAGADISMLLGASGGPRWLILGHLDRLLFARFLMQDRTRPLQALGSSVGSWRHACLAQNDPVAALDRFEDIYLRWEYSARPDVHEISAASLAMLEHILGDQGAKALIQHPMLHSYIVTARGKGLNAARHRSGLSLGMGSAAIANAVSRKLMAAQFQRVVFSSHNAPALPLRDFASQQITLRSDTAPKALHASGSIPLLLAGERDIPGAPPGHYWDGGIIDYHFDLGPLAEQPLILYPHFRGDLTTGWFDKLLPWRRQRSPSAANLILICPSDDFVASLPDGKIPDRSDFTRMSAPKRLGYWQTCIERSRELAEDFQRQLDSADPLANVTLLGQP
ncbi:MAG: patatin-like phospholipase family protein [Congregibacter sp.]|nr:patatin-like phospholipase family protein [Congregibacter sp.]